MRTTSASAVTRAVTSGAAVRVLPGVLALAGAVEGDVDGVDPVLLRQRAALLLAGGQAALSHTSALQRHGLPVPGSAGTEVHVTVPHRRRRRSAQTWAVGVRIHRCRGEPPRTARDGVAVVGIARAVVDAWPLLTGSDQRAPALVAVRRRVVTPESIAEELDRRRQEQGVRELGGLVEEIRAGCRSELELWGFERVFTGAGFEGLRQQVRLVVRGTTSSLDAYDPAAALAVELDGRAHHDSFRDREQDIARDARVATVGIQTLRSSHQRLTADPAGCRVEVLATAAVRRAQLAGSELPRVVEVPAARVGEAPVLSLPLPASLRL